MRAIAALLGYGRRGDGADQANRAEAPAFVIVDSGLVSDVGHHYRATRDFVGAAQRHGYTVFVCTPRSARPIESWSGKGMHLPCLSTGLYDGREVNERKIELIPIELIEAVRAVGCHPEKLAENSVFFFHTATILQAAVAVRLLSEFLPETGPRMKLLLRYEPGSYPERLRVVPPALKEAVVRLTALGRLEFFAETEELAASYEEYLGAPCRYLPHAATTPAMLAEAGRTGSIPTIGCLGEARIAKGFHLLPELIERMVRDSNQPTCRFIVQMTTRAPPPPEVEAAYQRLRALRSTEPDRITLIEKPLTETEYDQCIAQCDALLLPYNDTIYRRRGSGIVIDALLAGKPFIVPAGTWMAGRIVAGNGLVWCPEDDLVPVLRSLLSGIGEFSSRARNLATTARRQHDPDSVFQALINESGTAGRQMFPQQGLG